MGIFNFRLKYAQASVHHWLIDLVNEDAGLQHAVRESYTLFGSLANVWLDRVDSLINKYLIRGTGLSKKRNSPVHQVPIDQRWETREFYCNTRRRQYAAQLKII